MEKGFLHVVGKTEENEFLESGCTKTRLTGVAGCYALWKVPEGRLMQFFCLDFEREGLKGYKSLLNGTEEEQKDMMKEAIGVYGENFENLSEREMVDLLNLMYSINLKSHLPLPGKTSEYAHMLTRERTVPESVREEFDNKLSKKMETDFEAANYYMGRALARDSDAEKQLLVTGNRLDLVDLPGRSILLKNEVREMERFKGTRYCNCNALARRGTDYFLLMARLGLIDTVEGVKLVSSQFLAKKDLAVGEASMIIKRTEYLIIYKVADMDCFDNSLRVEKPCVEKEAHERGILFTQFKRNNSHYKNQTYFMNDDIFGLYFLMDEGKLIAATYSGEGLQDINDFLGKPCFSDCLTREKAFYSESPLFYHIVHQGKGKSSSK
ncbi:MAG: hypothetical protein C0604_06095 [Clostridiales bacterium]|nr:MAG: hypothetical protein C0604_06095 [Clostridiales bacterium]